jgi:hypothetical protein
MDAKGKLPSIHSLPVAMTGGMPARQGFEMQDHVAARYCIEALRDPSLQEVWCEAFDDVTIIWARTPEQEIEFIQVKGHQLDQLWSIAKLCEQDGATKAQSGTSIIERSLAQDRCHEKSWFRIVTARPFNDELKSLTSQLGSTERTASTTKLESIAQKIATKLNDPQSPNGNGCRYWANSTVCEAIHSLQAIEMHNLRELERTLETLGYALLGDQRQELYRKLVRKVWDAGTATQGDLRKLKRQDVIGWLQDAVTVISQPPTVSGQRMAEKMRAANLPEGEIQAAQQSRWQYRQVQLAERYTDPRGTQRVESEVNATLSVLRARLDVGEYQEDGLAFHKRCLDALGDVHKSMPKAQALGLGFVHGCMYNITDRCMHRFLRVTA